MYYPQFGVAPRTGGCGCGSSGPAVSPTHPVPAVAMKIAEVVQGEAQDEYYYRQLADMAPTMESKSILIGMANQEKRHNRLFRQLYHQLTGGDIQALPVSHEKKPSDYRLGVEQSILREIHAIEVYRMIYLELPSGSVYRDTLFEIMTDESNHQTKLLYLLIRDR